MLDGRNDELKWYRAKAETKSGDIVSNIYLSFRARNDEEALNFLRTQGYKNYELVDEEG